MASSSSRASQIKYVVFVCLLLSSKLNGVEAKTMSGNGCSSYPAESFTSTAPQIKHDVFVSFRGPDVRLDFLGHLINALSRELIIYFVDDMLKTGDEISPALLGAIERSLISLVIFSQNYASSRWCLEELEKIVECQEKDGQIVIPVFYNVSLSDIWHHNGTYGNAFVKLEKRHGNIRVQIWRSALAKSASVPGFNSSNYRNDDDLLEDIVTYVSMMSNNMQQVNPEGLIGIDKPIAHLESLLRQESKNVRVIGIWGMGGIGKTTIAEELFNRLCSEYEGCCFLANVREESGRHGIISLKKKLFCTLLDEEDLKIDTQNGLPGFAVKRLGRMKVLIVLDDVNDSNQLEILVGAHEWFGSGSRIIVTTRDKQVLAKEADDNDIYKVGELDFNESLQLFILNAFKQNLEMEYYKLSKRVVNYAKGVPLVLKVLGHRLYGKDREIWESELERLKKMPCKKVLDLLKPSYDDLVRDEKRIFLDIACFFDGLNLKVDYIKSLLKDRDYSVVVGLGRLKDKDLITISQDNIVSMHDIIQEMAWEIVRQESIEDPGNRSRLWDPDDIYQVLKNNKGSETIRSVAFNFSVIKELQLSPQVFAKMSKLQFLDFYSKEYQEGLYLPQGLESLPNELRYLRWTHYPLESLPTKFSAEKLVILNLPHSRVKRLWHGVQNLVNLKVAKLYNSSHLIELPDLSNATDLEVIDLRLCVALAHVHPSVFFLYKLEILNLGRCFSLTSLQSNIHLSSLRYLSLSGCKNLKEFSVISKKMEELNLEFTAIKELPSSFGHQSKLKTLRLAYSDIERLPVTIKRLTRLRHLDIANCSELRTVPELPQSLENLNASGCTSLKTVLFPSTPAQQLNENRKSLVFWNCFKLDEYSLRAIGLNAQINIMKFVYQDLYALERDYAGDYKYDAEAKYVYPGSKVPEWLAYRTRKDYITIDLSSPPFSPPLGFILCFIIPNVPSNGSSLIFTIRDGEGRGDNNVTVYLDRPRYEITSDHVCLLYDHGCTHYLNSRARNRPRFKIKATAVSLSMTSGYVPLRLKGFGVHPINPSEYRTFIQQMKLGDSTPNFSNTISSDKWNWAIKRITRVGKTLVIDIVTGLLICIAIWLIINQVGLR